MRYQIERVVQAFLGTGSPRGEVPTFHPGVDHIAQATPWVDGSDPQAAMAEVVEGALKPARWQWHIAPGHDLYKTTDADKPSSILDSNGEVVLGLCRRCGKGEVDLELPCTAKATSPWAPHSAAPWTAYNDVTLDRYVIRPAYEEQPDVAIVYEESDTKLIAAAPSLLEAARTAVSFLQHETCSYEDKSRAIRALRGAIAEAESLPPT